MKRIERMARILENTAKAAACAMFGLMLVVGAIQVLNRFLFDTSLSWSEELQRYLHIWLVFFSIPLAYRASRHIGLALLRERLGAQAGRVLDKIIHALWLAVFGATAFFTWRLMGVAKFQVTPGLGVRMDLVYAGLLVGCLIMVCLAAASLLSPRDGQHVEEA